jgi:hypothetical protein
MRVENGADGLVSGAVDVFFPFWRGEEGSLEGRLGFWVRGVRGRFILVEGLVGLMLLIITSYIAM